MPPSTWPDAYGIVGTIDILSELSDIDDLRILDHGRIVLPDGQASIVAYATAAAAAEAATRGCEVTLLAAGADRQAAAQAAMNAPGGTDGVGNV